MANLFEKIDNKIMASKIEQGMNMLQNKSTEELTAQMSKVNKEDVMKKLNEIDDKKIKDMNLDVDKIKKNLTPENLEKIRKIAGKDGEAIVNKALSLLNNAGKSNGK